MIPRSARTVDDDDLAAAFRTTMATVCTPVSIVTSMDGSRPHGTTVSAFASLSMEPPMVLVALDRNSDLLTAVKASGHFGINILASPQHTLALRFARKGADKMDGVSWALRYGVPRIDNAAGWLACELTDLVPGGDHLVALGRVLEAEHEQTPPLTYHSRSFGTHTPLSTT